MSTASCISRPAALLALGLLLVAPGPAGAQAGAADAGCDECRKLEVMLEEEQRQKAEREIRPGPGAPVSAIQSGSGRIVEFEYFYSPACSRCREFLESRVPALAAEFGLELRPRLNDVMTPEGLERLKSVSAMHGRPPGRLPVAAAEGLYLAGEDEIARSFRDWVGARAGGQAEAASPQPAGGDGRSAGGLSLSFAAVAGAGLLDGINPCAFSTVIFLVSSLAVAGRSRRSLAAIGLAFTAGVFLAYLAAGLGAVALFSWLERLPAAAAAVRVFLAAGLVVLAVLSLRDYSLARTGRQAEMKLQLPAWIKERIHVGIRGLRRGAWIGGAFALGGLVSLMELGCTGQVYLPVIAAMARRGSVFEALPWLVVYNIAFVLPLLAVLGLTLRGMAVVQAAAFFKARLPALKLASAVLFAVLAAGLLLV